MSDCSGLIWLFSINIHVSILGLLPLLTVINWDKFEAKKLHLVEFNWLYFFCHSLPSWFCSICHAKWRKYSRPDFSFRIREVLKGAKYPLKGDMIVSYHFPTLQISSECCWKVAGILGWQLPGGLVFIALPRRVLPGTWEMVAYNFSHSIQMIL